MSSFGSGFDVVSLFSDKEKVDIPKLLVEQGQDAYSKPYLFRSRTKITGNSWRDAFQPGWGKDAAPVSNARFTFFPRAYVAGACFGFGGGSDPDAGYLLDILVALAPWNFLLSIR